MTTLATDAPMVEAIGKYNSIPIIAADIVYEGAMVGDNASGYGRPLAAGDPFRGHCVEKVDNAAGAAGAKNIQLLTGRYRLIAALAGAITDVGRPVYATDDVVLTFAPGANNSYVGVVKRYVSATKLEIEFQTEGFADVIMTRKVVITSAQILLLETTQIELVAAPGADKFVEVLGLNFVLNYGSNVFTEPSAPDDLEVVYDTAGGTSIADLVGDFVIGSADAVACPVVKAISAAATTMINKAVVLDNNGSNYGGNAGDDTTITVTTTYRVVRAGL